MVDKEKAIHDMILSTLLASTYNEDKMKVSLMLDVSTGWINLIRDLCKESELDYPEMIEGILTEIFETGMIAVLEKLKGEYKSPIDILTKMLNTQ